MTANSDVSSGALNFANAVENGVDTRTGLYRMSLKLPEIQANDLRGPGFTLSLVYSALNALDSGWGYGWTSSLSEYSLETGILSVDTGETFKITGSESVTGRLTMEEQKLDSFHFYKDSDTQYRLMHKSGLIEILEVKGSARNRVAVPVKRCSPTGHCITLDYDTFDGTYPILKWVKDESGETLLTVKRTSAMVEILLHPHGAPDGGPLARFVMKVGTTTKYVDEIILPDDLASWRVEYRRINDHLCVTAVESPGGAREEMKYEDQGHSFPPSSRRKPMPRVTRHLTFPGFDQPEIDVRFTYKLDALGAKDHSFLGSNSGLLWENNGLDNLRKLSSYDFATVETLYVNDMPKRKIEREFNRFHLLTRQTTTQGNNVETVETTYFEKPGEPLENQPTYFQLPDSVKTTWSRVDNPNQRRSETLKTTFDNFGNLLTQTQPNGVVEVNTWYSAAGDDGCPADPEGFVRQLKSKTIIPAPSPNGQAQTLCTRYRYKALPALDASSQANWFTLESTTLLDVTDIDDEKELERTVVIHFEDPADAFKHGRVKRQRLTLNRMSTHVDYDYSKLLSKELNVAVQQTTETVTTSFDNVSRSTLQQHSLRTAQLMLTRAGGVETRLHYDVLGRLTSEVVAPGTAYEASREYHYTLSISHGSQAEHISINAKKIKTRSVMDGLGRLIFQERDHVDPLLPSKMHQTHSAKYDAWGNLIEQTVFDWPGGLELTSRFFYDDWAQQCRVIGPDNVEAHQTVDPIGTPASQGPIHRSWIQSPGVAPVVSGKSEIWMNLFDKPTRTATLDEADNVVATDEYLYDGLGRCTRHTDKSTNVTQYVYDARSRLVSSVLPDDSVVTRTYAPQSPSELLASLSVNEGGTNTPVGEQEYDGLGRLTRSSTGNRTERYAYDGDQLQVKTKTTPAGEAIEYGYNLSLTDRPISSKAPDENASFAYHPTSARLTEAINEQGTRKYGYNTANQLDVETWTDKQGTKWETHYSSSMLGRQLKRTDMQEDGGAGLDTVYTYDDVTGRLIKSVQGEVQALFDYNALGQLCKTTTKDTNSTLVTEQTYNDQGQETLRTWALNGESPRTQEQVWQTDGLLKSRHLQHAGATLLKETFEYDTRGRLTKHLCEGTTLPRDSEGREYKSQTFSFDALDNLKVVVTTFPDSKFERAIFTYSSNDPCQLASIAYMPARPSGNPTFTYNTNGCQVNDECGQLMKYDSQNRLLDVESSPGQVVSEYRYDSHDHLVTSKHGTDSKALRFYQGERLTGVVQDGRKTQLLYNAEQSLSQQVAGDSSQTLLLHIDANLSVIAESQQSNLRTAVYSAYGANHSDNPMFSLIAFSGELREKKSGWYLLGRGYRPYSPWLMRFFCPDSMSPFGGAGLNPYCYCLGNPIAWRDPTGHSATGLSGRLRRPDEDLVPQYGGGGGNWLSWVFVGVGVVMTIIGIAATIATAGAAAPLAGKAFAFTVAKATSIGVGTALGAASTAASAVNAANGDEEAGAWSMYLAGASLPFVVSAGVFGAMANAAKKVVPEVLAQFDELLALSKSQNIPRVKVPTLSSAASSQLATPINTSVTVSTIGTQTEAAAAISSPATSSRPVNTSLLASIRSGKALRPTPVKKPPAPKPLTDLQIAVSKRGVSQFDESGNLINTGGIQNAQALAKQGTHDLSVLNPGHLKDNPLSTIRE